MRPNTRFPADLVTLTGEVLNGKLHFLCSDRNPCIFHHNSFIRLVKLIFFETKSLTFNYILLLFWQWSIVTIPLSHYSTITKRWIKHKCICEYLKQKYETESKDWHVYMTLPKTSYNSSAVRNADSSCIIFLGLLKNEEV